MAEKIVEARKKSEDPKQEAVREQKAVWNSQVSQFISKLIALKKGINGRGEPKAGLPPSNIRSPMPPEVSLYLRNLATEYADIVQNADSIIKSQYQYSMTRRKSLKHASEIDGPIISQGSWWGSRLWSRMKLRALPKDIRKYRLELIRSAHYMFDELNNIEDKLYSTDFVKSTSGINQLAILSFGFLRSFLKQYNQLMYAYKKKPMTSPETGEQIVEEPTPEERSEEEGMQLPGEKDLKKELEKHQKAIGYINNELFDAEAVTNVMLQMPELGLTYEFIVELNNKIRLIRAEIVKLGTAIKTTGASEVLKLSEWAEDITNNFLKVRKEIWDLLKNHIDISSAKDFDTLKTIMIYKLQNIELPQNTEVSQKTPLSKDLTEQKKQASGIVSRWINRKLLRMSPSAENDIKLSVTEKLITVIHKFDEVMDKLEDKDSTATSIEATVRMLIDDYSKMLQRLQVLAKIIYLKQDEIKFTQDQPILKLKSSIIRDLGTVIKELEVYQNMVAI